VPIRYLTLLTAAVAAVAHVYAVLHDGVTLAAVTGAATAAALGGYALLSGARRTRWPLAGALAVLAVAFAARGVWYQPRPTSTYGWFSYGGGPPREYLRSVAQLFDESVSRQRWYAVCALLWAGLLAAVPLTLARRPDRRIAFAARVAAALVAAYLAATLATVGGQYRWPAGLVPATALQVLAVLLDLSGAVVAGRRGSRLVAGGLLLVTLSLTGSVTGAVATTATAGLFRRYADDGVVPPLLYQTVDAHLGITALVLLTGTALVVAGCRRPPPRPDAGTATPAATPPEPAG